MTVIERTDTVAHFIGGEEVPSASGRSFPTHRSVDRARDRPGRVRRGRGRRPRGRRRAGGVRVGLLVEGGAGPPRDRHAPPGRPDPPGCRPDRRDRVARHRQAARPGDRRGPPGRRLPDLLRRPRRAAQRHDLPGRRRLLRVLGPRAVRRRRRDQPVELPVPARLLEDRAGPRGRQLGRAQDGRADAAVHGRAGPPDAGGRDAGRRLQRRPRRRSDDGRRAGRPPARAQARRSPARP